MLTGETGAISLATEEGIGGPLPGQPLEGGAGAGKDPVALPDPVPGLACQVHSDDLHEVTSFFGQGRFRRDPLFAPPGKFLRKFPYSKMFFEKWERRYRYE